MYIDEGPSAEDLERFGDDTGHCPECGAEVSDMAEFCPECGDHIGGKVSSREPIEAGCRKQWMILIAIALLIAFAAMALRI